MQQYGKIASQPVPQSQPLRADQVPNNAGGFGWQLDHWQQLERFLLLGTIGGTYYVDERKLTMQNLDAVDKCIGEDPKRVQAVVDGISSTGRALKNDPALFITAKMIVAGGAAKQETLASLSAVARIPTHLFHVLEYHKQLGGKWNRSLRTAIEKWYNTRDLMQLAYHLTKYQSRDGWSHRDVLRLAHVKPTLADAALLFKDQLGKGVDVYEFKDPGLGAYMGAVWALKELVSKPAQAAAVISGFKLPREVVPTELLNTREVWSALLADMPTTALVRNLAKMTAVGLLDPMSEDAVRAVQLLTSQEKIARSRIHPLAVLVATMIYGSGRGERGSLTWTPNQKVLEALGTAFSLAFKNIEPTGKRVVVGLDISGSMQSAASGMSMSCAQAAAAVMYVLACTEPRVATMAFGTQAYDFPVNRQVGLGGVVAAATRFSEGTDCSLPFTWARERKIEADLFVVLTDNETWSGNQHPQQALDRYRTAMGIQSKVVLLSCAANMTSVGDPKDPLVLNAVGFDASVGQVIKAWA